MSRITKAELEEKIRQLDVLWNSEHRQATRLQREKNELIAERTFLRQCVAGLIISNGPEADYAFRQKL